MKIAYFQVDSDQLSTITTNAMLSTLQQLLRENIITDEQAGEFYSTHAVVAITSKSFLRDWAEKLGLVKGDDRVVTKCIVVPKEK